MRKTGIKEKLINAFLNKYHKSEQKTASNAEIQEQYELDLFRIAQDRYSIIKDVNYLCGPGGDIRFQRANALIGEDATKGGFSIVVNGSGADRKRKLKQGKEIRKLASGADQVQKILDDFLERTQLHILCTEHAKALLRDGDLFLNVVVDLESGSVLQIKRVPALTLKKNVNEYGEFISPEKAFSQINANEIYKMSKSYSPESSRLDFSIYQINHIRWLSDETKIYGTSQYAASRKCYRMLEKMEEALAYRRMYRSVSKRSHKLEPCTPAQIEEYKRANAMIDQYGNPTRNAHMLTDYIGNVEITALHDEANLNEIQDIEFMENTLWTNLLTPKAIITGGQNINRDVLKVQYPHYLRSLETITDRLEYGDTSLYSGYRAIVDLQLMLSGINPQNISYDIVWSPKSYETTMERVESIQNALGKNGGKQMISMEKAIQLIADDFDIEDPAAMYQKILEENQGNKKQIQTKEDNQFKKKEWIDTITQWKMDKKQNLKVIMDELEEDYKEMDQQIESFQKKWNSFFHTVYLSMCSDPVIQDAIENIVDVNMELVIENVSKTWDKLLNEDGVPEFYTEYIVNIGLKGTKTAKKILEELNFSDASIGLNMHLWKQDIRHDLLKFAAGRIEGIKETTLNQIRKALSDGYDKESGWKGIRNKIKPILVSEQTTKRKENETEEERKEREKKENYCNERATKIAITELSWAYNRSILRVYEHAGVKEVQWYASRDIKTCDYCRSMHGKIYPIHACPDNPDHPYCRCTWLPVRKTERRVV